MLEVQVFAMRHAEPARVASSDPPITETEENLARVNAAARKVENTLGDMGRLVICASPALRTYQTAEFLLRDPWLASHAALAQPQAETCLMQGAFDSFSPEISREYLSRSLKNLANRALIMASGSKSAGLVLVTHEPVLAQIAELEHGLNARDPQLQLGYAEVNSFTLSVTD